MLQTCVRCFKLGEILLDENRRLLVFCTQCHTDYDLQDFQQHLEYCQSDGAGGGQSLQSIFRDNVRLVFPIARRGQQAQHMLGRYVNNKGKEFHVYKWNGINTPEEPVLCKTNTNDDDLMDLIKIEEELLNPRWYTELSSTQIVPEHTIDSQTPNQEKQPATYHELVQAVTPFVHFKENFKTSNDNKKIVEQNVKVTPRIKSHILNGVNVPGRVLKKPNDQRPNFTVQSYVITKPRQTMLTAESMANAALLNNGNKSIKPPISNNSKNNCNKLPGNSNLKPPVSKNNIIKKLPNVKPQTVDSNNKVKSPEISNNSINRPADSNKKLYFRPAYSINNSIKLIVDKSKLKLPLQATTPNLPATNTTLRAPTTPATFQQNKPSTTATIKTDNQHNKKTTMKRTNESTAGPSPAKQLKPSSCASSVAANPVEICTPKVTTNASPGKTVQQYTQQILDKLQNLGLQVKIKEPASKQQKTSSSSSLPTKDPEKEKTLQIIKKLQSKGMNVKIIQPSKQASSTSVKNCHQPDDVQKRKKLEANISNGHAPPPPMNRNLIIKKLN